jgi:tRNA-specific 2-thiouridylase
MPAPQVKQKTIYIAMSGGVDSSVAAYLLKQQGFRVVGVFMKPWSPSAKASARQAACMWQNDRQDALRVASKLDIPLLTWDFSKAYGMRVARKMIDGYRRGITPNPDVDCNKEIKFGLFYQKAMQAGADAVATGHYARIVRRNLQKAKDANKDQTYFLWAINPRCVKRTLFPVGELLKPEVRKIAARAGLVTADKKDSQGVCFVGEVNVKDFLAARIKPRPGKIIHTDGNELGTHDGAAYYTVGQRHGLAISDGSGPYYVVRKDIRRNIVVVGGEKDLYGTTARLVRMNWFGPRPAIGTRVAVKIRYRTPARNAIIGPRGRLTFTRPVKAITPGQSAVMYRGNRVLGGGIIA